MAKRFDRSDFPKATKTPQGFLKAHAYATRIGVFKYRKPDGSVMRELRHPDEVFKADSMATLAGVPMTVNHPDVELLDAKNSKNYMVGFTGDTVEKAEDKFLATMVTLTDESAIKSVERGDAELSCGYTCDLVTEPGSFNGEDYDLVQRNIVYNHLAVLRKGRAGDDVRVHLDADDGEMVDCYDKKEKETKMPKLKIGEKEYDASPELHAAHEEMMAKHNKDMVDMKAKLDEFEKISNSKSKKTAEEGEKEAGKEDQPEPTKSVEMEKKMDAMQARMDAQDDELKKLRAGGGTNVSQAVNERLALLAVAGKIVPAATKLDSMSNEDIMKEVIKSDNKDVKLDGKSAEYVKARYEFVAERLGSASTAREDLGKQIASTRQDAGEAPDADAARAKMIKDQREQVSKPIGVNVKK